MAGSSCFVLRSRFAVIVGIRQGGALTAQESSGQTPPRALSSCFRPCSLLRPLRFQNLPLSGFTGRSVFGDFAALLVLCVAGFGWPPVRGRLGLALFVVVALRRLRVAPGAGAWRAVSLS